MKPIHDREKYEHGCKWFCDWHRAQGDDNATMIDLDGVGYCPLCFYAVYLVEATEQFLRKNAIVTERLGELANIPVFVFYRDEERHPDQFLIDDRTTGDIIGWVGKSEAWEILMSVRRDHRCRNRRR